MPSDTTADPTTLGSESGRVALRRRRDKRTDHVHEIPFNERVEVTCEDCGESIMVGIYGATERSYDSCWTWDCDAYHKFVRDRDAETDVEPEATETEQTTLVTDGGVDQDGEEVAQSSHSVDDVKRLQRSVELLEKEDDMECHWSPYCSREGEEYVTVHIGDKPYKVWVCQRCK